MTGLESLSERRTTVIDQIPEPIKEPATIETAIVGVVGTIKESFFELVAFAKSVGPDVWEIMIRQQYAEALSLSVALALALIVTALSYRVLLKRPKWAVDGSNCNAGGWVLSVAFTVVSVVLTGMFLAQALPRFLNPAYYALIELAKLKP